MEMNEHGKANASISYSKFDSSGNTLENEKPTASQELKSSGQYTVRSRCYRLAAGCLGLLCVLLLAAIIVLCIKFNHSGAYRDQLQKSNNDLTVERDQLQNSNNDLTIERDQLQKSNNDLTVERDQLQKSNNDLTVERDQLQKSNNDLTVERDQLQKSNTNLTIERDQLQTRYTNLTIERDQLQSRYSNLTIERDQLQTSNTNLTIERDQLQTSNTDLTVERDQLQKRNNDLTVERDQLQKSNTNLTIERDQLQTSNTNLTIERDQLQKSNNDLTIERDQLQKSNNDLTIKRDQLQTSYTNLTIERDQLQTRYANLTIENKQSHKEKDELQRKLAAIDRHTSNGWSYFGGNVYYMDTDPASWTRSRQLCRLFGADLAVINSKAEQDFLIKLMRLGQAWIGLTDRDTEGAWKWVNGSALTNEYVGFWCPGEPNDIHNEDCAELVYFVDKKCWNDEPCGNKKPRICEKRVI
ncbi:hypothetical protein NFI96_021931 [Prochilodus magdalenae]|nr:hypothetical protein NFI96_021931 [Prochilodus magdalenae]